MSRWKSQTLSWVIWILSVWSSQNVSKENCWSELAHAIPCLYQIFHSILQERFQSWSAGHDLRQSNKLRMATTGNGRLWHGHCDFYAKPQSYAWLWLQASNFLSFRLSDLCPSSSHSHNSHHCLVSFAKTEPVSTPCSGPRMEQYLPAATGCKMMQRSNRPPSLTPNQQQGYQVQDCDTCAVWTSFACLQSVFNCRGTSSSLCPLSLFWITTYRCGSHQTVQADGTT